MYSCGFWITEPYIYTEIQLHVYKTENPHVSKVYRLSVFELKRYINLPILNIFFLISFNDFSFEWYLMFDVLKVVLTVKYLFIIVRTQVNSN
jgi:thymidylate synthase